MEIEPTDDAYFTYDGRLASFQKTKKTTKGTKALNWPHKNISPESLAYAGFFFLPFPENPDNVVCFLCHKSMDGWEEGDDPLLEHLTHSSGCGWAIATAVEANLQGYGQLHPADSTMIEARKATFAGRWPHDGKRGWTCKTKQLVDAGWKYTPTPDSDDNATCAYCGLGLDGWEPKDKPHDEHYNRSPECPFFILSAQPKPPKKRGRKPARESKASRLSTQSVAASEAPSVADTTIATTAAADDSIMTTASTATTTSKKGRAKKATTAKGKKGKAKKEEPEEFVEEAPHPEPESSPVAPLPKKATRGKKRGSDAVDESTLTVASEAPAKKKRATKNRASAAVESSVIAPTDDEEMAEAVAPKKAAGGKKGRPAAKTTRKNSARSSGSMAPIVTFEEVAEDFPDDDEIERQLEADLERPLTDDEDITADSDSERKKAKAKAAKSKAKPTAQVKRSKDFEMFDPAPAEPNDEEVENELDALRAEMDVKEVEKLSDAEPEPEQLQIPKKGRKAAGTGTRKASKETTGKASKETTRKVSKETTRKVSKQTKAKKAQPVEAFVEEEVEAIEDIAEEVLDEQEASVGSTDTVVKKEESSRLSTQSRPRGGLQQRSFSSLVADEEDELADDLVRSQPAQVVKGTKGRGKASKVSQAKAEYVEPPAKPARGRPSKKSSVEGKSEDAAAQLQEEAHAADARAQERALESAGEEEVEIYEEEQALSPVQESPIAPSSAVSQQYAQAPSTPGHGVSPSASARQAALSPSQSPQSSDAENEPPSSKPAASVTTKRIALAPIDSTPVRLSPSKRNMLAGLQSKTPWKTVDLDAVFGTPFAGAEKENGVDKLLRKGKELTSPEKRMTVEEWIYFNAGEAENLLKHECEAMVSRFESEGTKAMNVLEELVVD